MADIFISYKRPERHRVEVIDAALREIKFSVWFDARLEVGRGQGFDSEIEREVTSAASVLVCWTAEAVKSVYVRAEAKKGLDRDVLVPVFLEPCALPIPFNAVDTADLAHWQGDRDDPSWLRVVDKLRLLRDKAAQDREALMARSVAAFDSIEYQIYPGTLALLTRKIAALHELDCSKYVDDIDALLAWLEAIFEKEAKYTAQGYELAVRQSGGSAWYFWERGDAAKRAAAIGKLCQRFEGISRQLKSTQAILEQPAP